jgi:hypothetical protein
MRCGVRKANHDKRNLDISLGPKSLSSFLFITRDIGMIKCHHPTQLRNGNFQITANFLCLLLGETINYSWRCVCVGDGKKGKTSEWEEMKMILDLGEGRGLVPV